MIVYSNIYKFVACGKTSLFLLNFVKVTECTPHCTSMTDCLVHRRRDDFMLQLVVMLVGPTYMSRFVLQQNMEDSKSSIDQLTDSRSNQCTTPDSSRTLGGFDSVEGSKTPESRRKLGPTSSVKSQKSSQGRKKCNRQSTEHRDSIQCAACSMWPNFYIKMQAFQKINAVSSQFVNSFIQSG